MALLREAVEPQVLGTRHFNWEGHVNSKQVTVFHTLSSKLQSIFLATTISLHLNASMTSGTAALGNNGSAPQFTKADQIKQLNDIDKVGDQHYSGSIFTIPLY